MQRHRNGQETGSLTSPPGYLMLEELFEPSAKVYWITGGEPSYSVVGGKDHQTFKLQPSCGAYGLDTRVQHKRTYRCV